jgi:hypothetical protein
MEDKKQNINYLIDINGAKVVERTSEKRGCTAENLLNSYEKRIWLSDTGLPQEVVIDITELNERPEHFTCFGWYCWQSYNSNPSLVELWVSSNMHTWEKWGGFQGSLKGGVLYHSIPPLGKEYRYLKVIVRDTFGASNTYINQLFLLEEYPDTEYYLDDIENLSELHLSVNNSFQDKFDYDSVDLKGKLKSQLDELQEEVKSMCSERNKSPRSLPSPFPSPIHEFISPYQPKNKTDEVIKLKKEVNFWSNAIKDIQKNIEKLVTQVSSLEKKVSNKDTINEISDFKEDIIQEIRKMELGSSRDSNFREDIENMMQEYMSTWESKVYKPQIATLHQKLDKSQVKDDPKEIMQKLKEKLALKAELEQRKQQVAETNSYGAQESRFRGKPSPRSYK